MPQGNLTFAANFFGMKMKTLRLALAAVLMASITQAQVSEKELLKKTEEKNLEMI